MSGPTIITLLIWLGIMASVLVIPSVVAYRVARLDRRRIMAEGASAQGLITRISPLSNNDRSKVYFSFQPTDAAKLMKSSQWTTRAAIAQLGLMVGSSVRVHYLPKWGRWGFVPALAYAERCLAASEKPNVPGEMHGTLPPLFYVSYGNPAANGFQWMDGSGGALLGLPSAHILVSKDRPT
jgi:hypothetical protein